jgi:hypothetical protein
MVITAVPDGYWDLPEDERLAAAGELAAQLQQGRHSHVGAGRVPGLVFTWYAGPLSATIPLCPSRVRT